MELRVRLQLAEAFGSVNRYFCCQALCQDVRSPEVLLTYYIKSGGAADFARRFAQAMSNENRWYCSQFYRRDVRDPQVLWEYYMENAPLAIREANPQFVPDRPRPKLHLAC